MTICPNCQTTNRPGVKFCTTCGQPLTAAAPPPAAPFLPPHTRPLPAPGDPPPLLDVTPVSSGSDEGLDVQLLEPFPFDLLPEGAFIGPDYMVQQVVDTQPALNRYFVTAWFENGQTERPLYLVKESDDWQMLGIELDIANFKLAGTGLRPPLQALQQRVGGLNRAYVVLPAPGRLLANEALPVEAPQAIRWGVALAQGLALLHERQIAFGQITPHSVSIEGDDAYLYDFQYCLHPGQPEQYADDVRQLAALLSETMTGEDTAVGPPPQLQSLFAQVMNGQQAMSAAEFAAALTQSVTQIRRPDSMDVRVGRRTDVGMVRQLNEDSLLVLDMVWSNRSISQPLGVYVVADGMGGHEGGEVASGLTVQMIARHIAQGLLLPTTGAGGDVPDYGDWLTEAVRAANTAVYERSKQAKNDMGTTLVMALMVGDEATIAHVGDSRAYHLHANGITQLTTDHSLVERLVATNQITRDEARHHPQSNVIYRTIGDKKQLDVDLTQARIGLEECLLLCSDGLSGMVTDEQMWDIVRQSPSPQAACDELIRAANAAGGDDNITVIIVRPEAS